MPDLPGLQEISNDKEARKWLYKQLRPYSSIYARLSRLLTQNTGSEWLQGEFQSFKLHSDPFMDLSVDYLGTDSLGKNSPAIRLSLAHNYLQNGDVMADPDMEIRISTNLEWPVAEALSYQQDGLGIYQRVYKEIDGKKMVSPKLKKQLNRFLLQWLINLQGQGFYK